MLRLHLLILAALLASPESRAKPDTPSLRSLESVWIRDGAAAARRASLEAIGDPARPRFDALRLALRVERNGFSELPPLSPDATVAQRLVRVLAEAPLGTASESVREALHAASPALEAAALLAIASDAVRLERVEAALAYAEESRRLGGRQAVDPSATAMDLLVRAEKQGFASLASKIEALAREQESAVAQVLLARLRIAQDRRHAARSAIDRALYLAPSLPEALVTRIELEQATAAPESARVADSARQRLPHDPDVRRAWLITRLGDPSTVAEELRDPFWQLYPEIAAELRCTQAWLARDRDALANGIEAWRSAGTVGARRARLAEAEARLAYLVGDRAAFATAYDRLSEPSAELVELSRVLEQGAERGDDRRRFHVAMIILLVSVIVTFAIVWRRRAAAR